MLTSFSLFLEGRAFSGKPYGDGPLDLRGYIGAWNGFEVTSLLYESATQTMNAAGTLQKFTFTPELTLTAGQQYVAFLRVSNLPAQPLSGFTMPMNTDNPIAGDFVFLNNGLDTGAWTQRWGYTFDPSDIWFQASFTAAVPEPSSWALLLLGVAAVAWTARRWPGAVVQRARQPART